MAPKMLSLCTGYGGLDLAVESVLDVELVAMAEFDKNASYVCEARFPGIPNLGDIKNIDWSLLGDVDVITAGYPCQPFSLRGKRNGTDDPRHLWPFILDGIRAIRPGLVVLENVSGHRSVGFDVVLGDLAQERYDVRWASVRASDIGACHQRERLFIVATDSDDVGREWNRRPRSWWKGSSHYGPSADDSALWGEYSSAIQRWECLTRPAPDALNENGRLSPLFVEWMMGLPKGWVTDVHGAPNKVGETKPLAKSHLLKILGNGVVPQQAEHAIRLLLG